MGTNERSETVDEAGESRLFARQTQAEPTLLRWKRKYYIGRYWAIMVLLELDP